ncbi:acetyltransferase [Pedobacter miscanthi]|uniref:acetyltransferase n=1 Tax=Pedobacter miscanthi TaxID=2259170 RepID=UPI00292D7BF9|nr:acetyltransferase [Pedobacter miscanthi]
MKAVIIGYSGHAFVVIDSILSANYRLIGYCEREEKVNNPYNLTYLGNENDPQILNNLKDSDVFLGLGDNLIRAKVFEHLVNKGIRCPYLVHSKANVSNLATIENGTVVMPGAVINSLAKIGRAVVCNSSSVIEHECTIDDYVHIAPGAVLAGNISVGKRTFIGANAVIRQGITIGENVIIGAGSVVVRDIQDGEIVYGNPAKKK